MATAVFRIADKTGLHYSATRQLHTDWGSPEYQIPYLADFYTWTADQHQPLTVDSFLAYAAAHPGRLPSFEPADGKQPSAVDYSYRLTLCDDSHGLHLMVQHRPGVRDAPPLPAVITQGNLFAIAAGMCERLAERAGQFEASHDGFVIPGGEPQTWLARARSLRTGQRRWAHATASLDAQHLSATFDDPHPGIQVAGAYVFAYVHRDGHLQVSVHLDETEPWLTRQDGTVPTQITVEHTHVFSG
jgi:hypothetical protein